MQGAEYRDCGNLVEVLMSLAGVGASMGPQSEYCGNVLEVLSTQYWKFPFCAIKTVPSLSMGSFGVRGTGSSAEGDGSRSPWRSP